jgi:hypothetical protein
MQAWGGEINLSETAFVHPLRADDDGSEGVRGGEMMMMMMMMMMVVVVMIMMLMLLLMVVVVVVVMLMLLLMVMMMPIMSSRLIKKDDVVCTASVHGQAHSGYALLSPFSAIPFAAGPEL